MKLTMEQKIRRELAKQLESAHPATREPYESYGDEPAPYSFEGAVDDIWTAMDYDGHTDSVSMKVVSDYVYQMIQ